MQSLKQIALRRTADLLEKKIVPRPLRGVTKDVSLQIELELFERRSVRSLLLEESHLDTRIFQYENCLDALGVRLLDGLQVTKSKSTLRWWPTRFNQIRHKTYAYWNSDDSLTLVKIKPSADWIDIHVCTNPKKHRLLDALLMNPLRKSSVRT